MPEHGDGGPAFPLSAILDQHGNLLPDGMSLHAFYAGLAMHAFVNTGTGLHGDADEDDADDGRFPCNDARVRQLIAIISHRMADDMIAEMRRREKNDAK